MSPYDPTGARILVVEDNEGLREGLLLNLELEGYAPVGVADGREALEQALAEDFDLVILDVMLPSMDGFEICSELRDADRDVPILFLTARTAEEDRIRGLSAGADDYLPKPFRLRELLLRVGAILRRTRPNGNGAGNGRRNGTSVLSFADNEIDLETMRARSWDGREHSLGEKEAAILRVLAEHEGEVVSRDEILEGVYRDDVFPSSRTIERHVARLRRRFERDEDRPAHFHTIGVGFSFTRNAEKD